MALRPRRSGTRAQPDDKQADIASKRRMCTAFETWHSCSRSSCGRHHFCFGDPLACFDRYWDGHPNAFYAWIVAASDARATGLTMRQAMRVADDQARGGRGCVELPWVRPYLKSFDKVAPRHGARAGASRHSGDHDGKKR